MSDEELVRQCNELARSFYRLMGYVVHEDYQFYKANHPHERMCWQMAVAAYEHVNGSDVENALAECE